MRAVGWSFSQGVTVDEPGAASLVASAGEVDPLPESRRAPGGGAGSPLQCSFMGNPMGRGAWGATVHGVATRDTTERAQHTCLLQVVRVT